jgi:hypothetical protein
VTTYRVNIILERTYGTALVEAESFDEAQDKAAVLTIEDYDTAVDSDSEIIEIYEEQP